MPADSSHEGRPLGGYAVLMSVFTLGMGGLLGWAASKRRLPDRFALTDIALLGVATHKLTRIVTKDRVTSPLRSLFVELEDSPMPNEVGGKSTGEGLQHAIGDLITCEYCSAPWVAGALIGVHVAQPRVARLLTAMWSAVALSDFLNHAYVAAAKSTHKLSLEDAAATTANSARKRATRAPSTVAAR
jgi:hypothetical protein